MARAESKLVQARKQRVAAILPILHATYPDAQCTLDFKTPFQLLIATILSAQCTDARVNIVTKDLFRKYPTPESLANARAGELEKDIQTTGFFRSKARSLRGMAASLIENYHGKVPQTMEALVGLAGVGRKTANVVLGNAFGQNIGVVVDTHVTRVSGRLGLTKWTDAQKIEQDLMAVVPTKEWTIFSHLLIFHGRTICVARSPRCEQCPIFDHCPTGPRIIAEREKAGKSR